MFSKISLLNHLEIVKSKRVIHFFEKVESQSFFKLLFFVQRQCQPKNWNPCNVKFT